MYFDRFDIVHAHATFYNLNHSGQTDPFYAKLCRILKYYKPPPIKGVSALQNTNQEDIYNNLAAKHNCPQW